MKKKVKEEDFLEDVSKFLIALTGIIIIVLIFGFVMTSVFGAKIKLSFPLFENDEPQEKSIRHEVLEIIDEVRPEYIGEYYGKGRLCEQYSFSYMSGVECYISEIRWHKFEESDISDEVGEHVKIKDVWIPRENIIYFSDVFKDRKSFIEDNSDWKFTSEGK